MFKQEGEEKICRGTISRRLWAKAGAERIPLTGAFELLPICNFACKMCYVRKSRAEVEKAGGLMDGKRWLEIAEDAAKCGLLFPLLTGGGAVSVRRFSGSLCRNAGSWNAGQHQFQCIPDRSEYGQMAWQTHTDQD